MRAAQPLFTAVVASACGLAAVAGALLVACGTGDDNAASVPAVDAGSDATVDAGAGALCVSAADGSDAGGEAGPPDPYTACSPYVAGCIPFAAARVPVHPDL